MMTLHGVDVYIRHPEIPDIPKEHGTFALIFISMRGTRVTLPLPPGTELVDWLQCRYFSETEVTDQQVDELVSTLTGLGWQWTKCQKLFMIDGVNAFSQPY